MKWIGIFVFLVVALVGGVIGIGLLLPVRHRVTRSAMYRRPPDALREAVTAVSGFPAWRPGVERIEMLPAVGGHERYREVSKDGAVTYEVMESGPRRFVTRIVDKGLPYGGAWTYDIEDADSGSRLRITEDGEVYNPIFRFVSRFILGHSATIDTYLRALGAKFGESTVTESH